MESFVAALLIVSLAASPHTVIQSHSFRIERSGCGLHKKTQEAIDGRWVSTDTRVVCSQ